MTVGPATLRRAGHSGEPGHPVERMRLRNRESEHAEVDPFRRDAAARELALRDLRGELDAVQVGEAALPARERRAPVGAVGNFGSRHVRVRERRAGRYSGRTSAADLPSVAASRSMSSSTWRR